MDERPTPAPRRPCASPRPPRNGSRRERPGLALLGAVLLAALVASLAGCRSDAGPSAAAELSSARLDERIEALERRIAEDHATLADLVARPRDPADPPLYADPTVRLLAARLAEDAEGLDALRAARRSR